MDIPAAMECEGDGRLPSGWGFSGRNRYRYSDQERMGNGKNGIEIAYSSGCPGNRSMVWNSGNPFNFREFSILSNFQR